LQPVATRRKSDRLETRRHTRKPLPAVATCCLSRSMVRRGSTVRVRQRASSFLLLSQQFRCLGWRRLPVSTSTSVHQRPPSTFSRAELVEQADRMFTSVTREVARGSRSRCWRRPRPVADNVTDSLSHLADESEDLVPARRRLELAAAALTAIAFVAPWARLGSRKAAGTPALRSPHRRRGPRMRVLRVALPKPVGSRGVDLADGDDARTVFTWP
jgi:hypothetical protein